MLGPRPHPASADPTTMGRQWLQKKREINANKRAKIVTKLVREITVAAKMGVPDPR
jgi:transcriptional/translational regulatory protein YebC/TACO1